jgi:hypothetical protein
MDCGDSDAGCWEMKHKRDITYMCNPCKSLEVATIYCGHGIAQIPSQQCCYVGMA